MQADRIREAVARLDYGKLQMLIQGSLLVQVNEGPLKMAEVFLSGGDETERNDPHRRELIAVFRQFLAALASAVMLHSEYVKKNPVWASLQEKLETGLGSLTSALQPYFS
jgi:hypothetical protein